MIKNNHRTFYETVREDGKFISILIIIATLLFIFISFAYPIMPGLAIGTYLDSCHGTSNGMRMLGSVFALCHLLEMNDITISIILYLLYLTHILAVYYIGSYFGTLIARLFSFIILCHVQIAVLFHTVGSEMLVCIVLSLLVAFTFRVHQSERYLSVILVAILTFLMTLFRPEYIVYAAIGVYPVFCRIKESIIDRIKYSLVYFTCIVFLASGYSIYNYFNSSFLGLVNGVGQMNFSNMFPSRSLFNINPMLDEKNGPASKQLFAIVKEDLLNGEEYMLCEKHVIRAKGFFTSKYEMNWSDMINEVERQAPGQNLIFKASMEAIQRSPINYILGSWVFPMFHLAHVKTDFYLPIDQPSPVTDHRPLPNGGGSITPSQESTKSPEHTAEIMVQKMQKQQGNYHAAFFLKYSLFDLIPPIAYFMFFSVFIIFSKSKAHLVLLSTLLPSYLIFFLYSQLSIHSRLRLPYDFIFILSGILGAIIFLDKIKSIIYNKN
ncbi:MAG: hypothetical protein HQL89_08760 [Magnetococcales bacterium]|nr:hypothetical protein [Magnetococcales bacterium]